MFSDVIDADNGHAIAKNIQKLAYRLVSDNGWSYEIAFKNLRLGWFQGVGCSDFQYSSKSESFLLCTFFNGTIERHMKTPSDSIR